MPTAGALSSASATPRAVFQRVEGFGILVEFQQFDFRMAFGEEGVGGGAFVDQKGLVFQLCNVGNRFVFGKLRPKATFM